MLFIDAFFRFSGIGLLLLLAGLVWRDHRQWQSAPYLILSCISVAGLFVGYVPEALRPPEPIYLAARFLDIPHLVFVWLFALSLFNPAFKLRFWHILVGVLYTAPIVWLRLSLVTPVPDRPDWLIPYGSITSILLMGHLCYATLRGRADDLLEKRRASRIYFVIAIVFVAIVAALTDPIPPEASLLDKRTIKILSIWMAIVWGTVWMLGFSRATVSFGRRAASGRQLESQDNQLKGKLIAAMLDQEVFRETGLTITRLAANLGVSQHRLRTLINDGLGYPNFSAFLNEYRIEAVKEAFLSKASAHLPILTIAMDCGFKSLSPFNKAFRDKEGTTPSEYRRALALTETP